MKNHLLKPIVWATDMTRHAHIALLAKSDQLAQ